MKHLFISILLLVVTTNSCLSQLIIDGPSIIDSAIIMNNYELAIRLLQVENSSLNEVNYKLAKCYSKINKNDSTIYYLEKLVDKTDDVYYIFDPDFEKLNKEETFIKLKNHFENKFKRKYPNTSNISAGLSILRSHFLDQYYRGIAFDIRSLDVSEIVKKNALTRNDSFIVHCNNTIRLDIERIVIQDEIPNYSSYDKALVDDFGTLLLHMPLETQIKIYPKIDSLVKLNKFDRQSYAVLTDKILSETIRMQLYGTQFFFDNGKLSLFPIIEADRVDDRRKNMEIPVTLEVYRSSVENSFKVAAPKPKN